MPSSSLAAAAAGAGAAKKKGRKASPSSSAKCAAKNLEHRTAATTTRQTLHTREELLFHSVWNKPLSHTQTRAAIAKLYKLTDGPGVCTQSIALDGLVHRLVFARDSGMNPHQTRLFLHIYQQIEHMVAGRSCSNGNNAETAEAIETATPLPDDGTVKNKSESDAHTKLPSIDDVIATFKRLLLQNSTLGRGRVLAAATQAAKQAGQELLLLKQQQKKQQLEMQERAAAAAAFAAQEKKASSRGGNKSSSKRRPTSKGAASSKKKITAVSSSPPPLAADLSTDGLDELLLLEESDDRIIPFTPSQLFTIEQVKAVNEFMLKDILGHFHLFRAVLNPTIFSPQKQIQYTVLSKHTHISDHMALGRDAIDLTEREQKEKEALDPTRPAAAEKQVTALQPSSSAAVAAGSLRDVVERGENVVEEERKVQLKQQPRAPNNAVHASIAAALSSQMESMQSQILALLDEREAKLELKLQRLESRLGKRVNS